MNWPFESPLDQRYVMLNFISVKAMLVCSLVSLVSSQFDYLWGMKWNTIYNSVNGS